MLRTVIVGLIALLAQSTLAQDEDLSQPPQAIQFDQPILKDDGDWDITFPSAIVTEDESNNTVYARVRLPKNRQGPVPVVIVLHYLGATDLKVESSLAEELSRKGVATVMLTLPYHLTRRPPGQSSAEYVLRPDIPFLMRTVRQTVLDIRRTIDWIEVRPEFRADRIAISGTSLGAVIASLAYSVDSRITTASFSLGGVDLAHILWKSTRTVLLRDALRRRGYTEARLREELQAVEPLNRLRKEDGRPVLVIGARYDTVVPARTTEKLIASLGNVESVWLDTGHYGTALVERRLTRLIASYLAAKLLDGTYRPVKSVFAPTIRLGVHISDTTGTQVAVGIDLWRLNRTGDAIATAMITPKGPVGFVGYRLSNGFFAGVSVTPRRTTWGVMWTIVL